MSGCKDEDDCATPMWCRGKSVCPKRPIPPDVQALTPGNLELRKAPDEIRHELLQQLGEALHENDRLRRLLKYELARVDELKRRLHIYRGRDEAVEIARLHGVIASLKAQVEGRYCMPPAYLVEDGKAPVFVPKWVIEAARLRSEAGGGS